MASRDEHSAAFGADVTFTECAGVLVRGRKLLTVLFVLLVGGLTFAGTWDECDCRLHPATCGGGAGTGDAHSCDGTWPGCVSLPPAGPIPTPTATPLPLDPPMQPALVGKYSYRDTSTSCTGELDNVKDPISIVVHVDQNAAAVLDTSPWVSDHLSHHGLDVAAGNAEQYFHYGLECVLNGIGQADSGGSSSRNHARGLT